VPARLRGLYLCILGLQCKLFEVANAGKGQLAPIV